MATYRGSDGSLTIDGDSMAELQSWKLNTSRPVLDTTAMGDTAGEKRLDILNWDGEATVNFDYGDPAQAALVDAMLAAAEPAAMAGVFRVSATKTFTGNILPTSIPITSQRGNLVTASFSFTGTGALAVAWA